MWFWLFADQPGPGNPPRPSSSKPAPSSSTAPDIDDEDEFDDEEDEGVVGEVNDVMKVVMPWMISLLAHVAVMVLAMFLIWKIWKVPEKDPEDIIPVAKLSQNPGGSLAESQDKEQQKQQNKQKVEAENTSETETPNNKKSELDTTQALIGNSGGGGGGKLAPYGANNGKGGGIGANFYGTGGNANDIVFVVDASGSLIDTMPFVIAELKNTLRGMREPQRTQIYFFQNGAALRCPVGGNRNSWITLTDANKQAVMHWLDGDDIVPRGQTNPVEAIKSALQLQPRPQLMFILSDNITGRGKYEVNRNELLDTVAKLNTPGVKGRKAKINTIQFLYPDPLNTLRDIAKGHGGTYKFVDPSEVGR